MITLTVGIPASGKSTWSKAESKRDQGIVRICRDDFRQMLQSSQMMQGKGEELVSQLVESSIRQAVSEGYDVIVDQTNCNPKYLRKLISFCQYLDDVSLQFFDISLKEAMERNSLREMKVPDSVIKNMHNNYDKVRKDFDDFYDKIDMIKYVPDVSRPKAVIFDIDGTLAIMGDRSPYDWKKVGLDSPNYPVVEALRTYMERGYNILIFSGRDSVCHEETMQWLENNNIGYDLLLMRSKNDMRQDTQVKYEMFNIVRDLYHVVSVYDDRKSVKRMWVSIGLHVFDCNQNDEEF